MDLIVLVIVVINAQMVAVLDVEADAKIHAIQHVLVDAVDVDLDVWAIVVQHVPLSVQMIVITLALSRVLVLVVEKQNKL